MTITKNDLDRIEKDSQQLAAAYNYDGLDEESKAELKEFATKHLEAFEQQAIETLVDGEIDPAKKPD
jgi:hypothetical protein